MNSHLGFSITELMAVVTILSVLAVLIVPRVMAPGDSSKRASCSSHQCEIEVQVKLWKRINGSYPAANLSNIGSNEDFFPHGLPTCPVDGSAYTIDTTTGLVTGHTH